MGSLFYYCERKDALWQVLDHSINIFYLFLWLLLVQVSSSNSLPLPHLPANGGVDKILINSQGELARVLTLIGQNSTAD
jgi:hypothetical protein